MLTITRHLEFIFHYLLLQIILGIILSVQISSNSINKGLTYGQGQSFGLYLCRHLKDILFYEI